jgi:phosphoglycerol transferase MdoB-like AlkP superfamily enzyme
MASSAFIACLIWGEVRFIPLLGVLAVWIPPTTLRRADPEFLARLLTWSFALLAILISHLLQSDLTRTIQLAADFTIPEGPSALPLAEAIAQQKQFGVILFAVVALVIFTLQAINRWYPSRHDPAADQKRLVIVFGVGLVMVVVLNVSYLMGSQISLAVKGLKTPSAILRQFGE